MSSQPQDQDDGVIRQIPTACRAVLLDYAGEPYQIVLVALPVPKLIHIALFLNNHKYPICVPYELTSSAPPIFKIKDESSDWLKSPSTEETSH